MMGVRLLVGIWPPRSSIIMVCVSVSTKNISFGVTAAGAPKILLLGPSDPTEESVASGEICMRERARDITGKVLPRKEHTARRRGPDGGCVQVSRRRKKGKQKEGVVAAFRGDA